MEGKRYKGMFIYYEPRTQEEWTDTEWCNAYNLEQAKEILKKRNPNLIWVCSEDNKERWHIKEDNPDWKSRTEILYDRNNKQVYESMNNKKQTIKLKLNESQLRNIIKESIKNILYERKPADRQVGPHLFKGVKYDTNGNPNYTCDTVPDDWKKTMRWKMSQKHGLHGQLGDPSKVPGVISEEYNSDAFSLMDKVRKCVMLNLASEIGGNHHEITRGENNSILVINRDNPSEGVKVSFDFYNADI